MKVISSATTVYLPQFADDGMAAALPFPVDSCIFSLCAAGLSSTWESRLQLVHQDCKLLGASLAMYTTGISSRQKALIKDLAEPKAAASSLLTICKRSSNPVADSDRPWVTGGTANWVSHREAQQPYEATKKKTG